MVSICSSWLKFWLAYGICRLTRTFGSIAGHYGTYTWAWYFWRVAHEYVMMPFAIFLCGTALVYDLAYSFVLSSVKATELVLPNGRKVSGESRDAAQERGCRRPTGLRLTNLSELINTKDHPRRRITEHIQAFEPKLVGFVVNQIAYCLSLYNAYTLIDYPQYESLLESMIAKIGSISTFNLPIFTLDRLYLPKLHISNPKQHQTQNPILTPRTQGRQYWTTNFQSFCTLCQPKPPSNPTTTSKMCSSILKHRLFICSKKFPEIAV